MYIVLLAPCVNFPRYFKAYKSTVIKRGAFCIIFIIDHKFKAIFMEYLQEILIKDTEFAVAF